MLLTRRSATSCVCAVLACLLAFAAAAAAQTVTDERAWLLAAFQGPVGAPESKWRWVGEVILRSRDRVSTLDLFSPRITFNYRASARATFGAGYVLAESYPAAGGVTTEHRTFLHYVWTGSVRRATVSVRSRIEARFIEGNSGTAWRLREQVRVSHPLRTGSRVSFVAFDELFLHVNTTPRGARGVDQNRVFAGLGMTWSPRARAEAGYLNQFSPGRGAAARMNHVLSGVLTLSF
jgi:Protein of unknown function (DUF2490)